MLSGSNVKKVTKIAKKAYKKIPKKKLVKKATSYGISQFIGGPYLTVLNIAYKKSKNKVLTYAGSYAYESFLRSKFARERLNSLPMSIVSMVLRTILNFLIFSRLVTGYRLIDFFISIVITVFITLLAPLFYKSVEVHKEGFMEYTNNFIDNFMGPDGWEYVENFKNRSIMTIGIGLILLLQFVEVNSRFLQEFILHSLITGFISDRIQKYIDDPETRVYMDARYIGMTWIDPPEEHILGPHNDVKMKYKRINYCHTDNRVIIGMKPLRAEVVPHDKLKDYIMVEIEEPKRKSKLVEFINDYSTK